jgi:hypothetical protein
MSTRTCKVGVHGRNDERFEEGDYQAIREAKIEVVKMMSHTRLEVFQRIKAENPGIEIITRLFYGGGFIEPGQFIQRMIPVMGQLKPYCTMFQIANEPNHVARIEGWGAEDADARNFNSWFLQVYAALKEAHPWAQLGFPGLAIPDAAHRDRAWLQICREAITRADWLGCHCYWQTPPNGGSVMLADHSGLCFKYYHEAYPDKVIHILECGNSNGQNPAFSTDENLYAEEYVTWLGEVFKYPYIGSASFFLLSSPDPAWHSFAWRRDGRMTSIVSRIGAMVRPPLRPVSVGEPPVTPSPVPSAGVPIGLLPNVFTNQHLINAFFYLAGELGLRGDDLLARAGLDVHQLAADEATRQVRYSGPTVDRLPGLTAEERARLKANLVRELRNVKRWSGVVNAPAGLRLRSEPSTEAAVIANLTDQTPLEILNDDDPQSPWLLVATNDGAAGFVARDFVRRTDAPTPMIAGQPPVITPSPAGPPVQRLPGFFCSDPELATVPLAATGPNEIPIGAHLGPGAQRLANTWNRYGGLLTVLADKLGIDPAVAVAVLLVESGGAGFANGRMIIRFENHLFYEEWGKAHADRFFQHFSFGKPVWEGHTWRPSTQHPFQSFHGNQDAEWQVLTFAAGLDDTAAKRSISMGAPQILGRNHERIGYPTVQAMFNAFSSDERAHILGLFDFIRTDAALVQALRSGNYVAFASGYNGTGQAQYYANLINESRQAFLALRPAPAMAAMAPAGEGGPALDPEQDAAIAFLPIPQPPGVFVEVEPTPPATETGTEQEAQPANVLDQELRAAWRKHVEQGLQNNNIMFNRVLQAFMIPYYLTVAMYILLFLVGVGLFILAARLATGTGTQTASYIFGGLGVVTFLAFFVSKPLRSLEENLQFITWLGIIYNTYWTRLLYMQNATSVHADLKDATSEAEASIGRLIDKNTALSKDRPGFSIR